MLKRIDRLEALDHAVTIYPDAEQVMQTRLFLDRIRKKVADIRADPEGHRLRKELLKTDLLPFQLDGIAFAVGAGRAVLADDMGLGKTIQGIGVAELLAREAGIGRVLVICPASLKTQWQNEIERFCDRDCQLVIGSAASRAQQYDHDRFFTVCNYEQVLRDILAIERASWDLIILDEGQRIKNWEAKTSAVVKGLRSTFALVLSGTPLENRLGDIFSIVEFIDSRRLGPAFRFFNRHRVVDERGKVLGYKNLAELRAALAPVLLRRTRSSVLPQLPPRTTEFIRIPATAEQLDLHDAHLRVVASIVAKKFLTEMDLLRLRKALLMCRLAADSTYLVDKKKPGYSSKLQTLDDLLGRFAQEQDRKIVLFSEWKRMLDLIEPLLRKNQMRYVRLDGSVPQSQRSALVQQFQEQPDCRVIIMTNAGSTGLNLQAANTVINVDLPWNPAVLEQRIGRAHRMGQKRPVHICVLVTEGTIEEKLLTTLSAKQQLALATLDTESDVDTVDLETGMEELKRRLEILLGAKPEAPIDESVRHDRQMEAMALTPKQRVATAGGQLLSAAFQFLGEILPAQEETPESRKMSELLRRQLGQCINTSDGRTQLTVTLPNTDSLDRLASSLGHLLASYSKQSAPPA